MIPIVTIPLTVLAVAVPFYYMGLSFNVMSLGGLACSRSAHRRGDCGGGADT
jgi:multidrug efflux pump subunit AcrB